MNRKTAFSNGGSTAARLPAEAGIKPGDPISLTIGFATCSITHRVMSSKGSG
jgi:hypothetical protein